MNGRRVGIIYCATGNIKSIYNAIKHCDGDPVIIENSKDISKYSKNILPGVGNFAHVMREIKKNGYDESIINYVKKGGVLLGICVGMQVLFNFSEESGGTEGLGLTKGIVKKIPRNSIAGADIKLPHIGWSPVTLTNIDMGLFAQIKENSHFYFVHSYTAWPEEERIRVLDTYYGGRRISAAIRDQNLYGCQFHPERSGPLGLEIFKRFLDDSG